MKKVIIATLISAILMFAWNAASWMFLPVHEGTFKYTAQQDSILHSLGAGLPEDGAYMLPAVDPASPNASEEEMKLMEERVGKPWAMVVYGKSMPGMDPFQFIRGFFYYLLMSFLGAVILMAAGDKLPTFFQRLWILMLIPIIIVLDTSLESINWMYMPWHFEVGNIIDTFVSWALGGSVLAALVKRG